MTEIKLAKTAGFCFGVNRAVDIVWRLVNSGEKVCTLGPIIHNAQMVNELADKGVRIVNSPKEVASGETVVIRSHGVGRNIYDEINELGLKSVDATCPFVAKIHKTVRERSSLGDVILIVGDKNHPEVIGIQNHCTGENHTVKSPEEIEELAFKFPYLKNKPISVVAQTTFDIKLWEKCLKTIKKVYTNANFFGTICNATTDRQTEAAQLSQSSDFMVVIGDRNSSNTCKLYNICKSSCENTVLAQTKDDILPHMVLNAQKIGVTAGASAPARIIKEVLDNMTEILNNSSETNTENAEGNFAEMLEENLKSLNTDGRVQGVVLSVAPNEVLVDVGRKQSGIVKLEEFTNDPNAKLEDLVKVGDTLDLLIMRTNDQEGVIMLSKKRIDALKGWDNIVAASESNEVLSGTVTDVIKGGVLVASNGMKIFVPASQATLSRNDSLDELLRKEVNFRIIDVDQRRRRAVGSIKSVLKEENDKIREEFWKNCEVGKVYTGVVKSLTSYGAFVDIGGVDGMIHISELSWSRIKHPSEVVNVGDTVEVYVKDIDTEKGNISLGYKKSEDNPWEILKRDYPVGTVVEAQIVGMVSFGAFARILPGIDGLIHISQIADRRIEKPQDELKVGQVVNAKITAIDFDKKRVSLSMRALLEEAKEQQAQQEDEVVATTEEAPAETAEEAVEAPAEEAEEAVEAPAEATEEVAEAPAETTEE